MGYLGDIAIKYISKQFSQQADFLIRLASMLPLPYFRNQILMCQNWIIPLMFGEEYNDKEDNIYHISIHEIKKEIWRHPIIDYHNHEKLPENS